MITRRRLLTVTSVVAALIGISLPAWAYFTATASTTVSSTADSLSAPSAASAVGASTSSMTITVTAVPATGATPSAYRVDRTSITSPGTKVGACTITAVSGLGSCTDVGPLQASTIYAYTIYSQIGTQWTSTDALGVSGATSAEPFKLTGVSFGGLRDGTPATDDTMTMTFSANVKASTVPTSAPPSVTFSRSGNGDTFISMPGIFASSVDSGQGYFDKPGTKGTSFASTVTVSGATVVVKLGARTGDTPGSGSSGASSVSIPPAASITDTSGNAASGSLATATGFAFF